MRLTPKLPGLTAQQGPELDPRHVYSLPELIDFAQAHNPETRAAWESAKQRAAQLGVSRAALFPTLAVAAVAQQTRDRVLFGNAFFLQNISSVLPVLTIYYSILDFGRRATIETAEANVLAADFSFNNTHRQIIYSVATAFFHLNSAIAQAGAAEATLLNAQTVQSAVEARLNNGLATLPDVLQARSATAQAAYDLETVRGVQRLAHGELADALGVRPTEEFSIESLNFVPTPALSDSADAFINRALVQRPDLLAQAAQIKGDEAAVRSARAQYFPSVNFSANAGDQYQRGTQPPNPSVASTGETWLAKFSANWTIFDGRARYNELDRARSAKRQDEAMLAAMKDHIADEVWAAYTNVETSLHRQEAARMLLTASEQSYNAALEAYRYGVRNFLDVVAAQRTLAQARSEQVQSQSEVLANFAQLAFATGDMASSPRTGTAKP